MNEMGALIHPLVVTHKSPPAGYRQIELKNKAHLAENSLSLSILGLRKIWRTVSGAPRASFPRLSNPFNV